MHDVNLRIFTTTIILYDSILYRMSSFDFFYRIIIFHKERPQTICFSEQQIKWKMNKILHYVKKAIADIWKKLCTSIILKHITIIHLFISHIMRVLIFMDLNKLKATRDHPSCGREWACVKMCEKSSLSC